MKYTEDHEWLSLDGDIVTVGITAHADATAEKHVAAVVG